MRGQGFLKTLSAPIVLVYHTNPFPLLIETPWASTTRFRFPPPNPHTAKPDHPNTYGRWADFHMLPQNQDYRDFAHPSLESYPLPSLYAFAIPYPEINSFHIQSSPSLWFVLESGHVERINRPSQPWPERRDREGHCRVYMVRCPSICSWKFILKQFCSRVSLYITLCIVCWCVVSRIGGSGMDMRSKARVSIINMVAATFTLALGVFSGTICYMIYAIVYFHSLCQDLWVALKSFPNGTMMAPALDRLKDMTAKSFYSNTQYSTLRFCFYSSLPFIIVHRPGYMVLLFY